MQPLLKSQNVLNFPFLKDSNMRKGVLAIALEDAEQRVDPVEPTVDTPPVEPEIRDDQLTGEAPEADAMADVVAADTELNDLDSSASDAVAVADTLEATASAVTDAVETEGGMSENGAKALDTALEGLLTILGAQGADAKVFPALEGFKEPASKMNSTKLALEAINDRLKSVWAGVLEVINKIIDHIVTFYKAVMNGTTMLIARAKMIVKAAEKKKGAKAAELIPSKKFAKYLAHNGKVLSGSDLARAIDAITADKFVFGDDSKIATEANKTIVQILGTLGEDKAAEKAGEAVSALLHDMKIDVNIKRHDLPLGGATFGVYPTFTGAGKDARNLVGATVTLTVKQGAVAEEVPGMTPDEAMNVLRSVDKNLQAVHALEKHGGEMKAAFASMTSSIKAAMSKAPSEGQANSNKVVHDLARAVNVIKAVTVRGSQLAAKYNLDTMKAAVDYCGASVAAAKTEKVADKEPAAA